MDWPDRLRIGNHLRRAEFLLLPVLVDSVVSLGSAMETRDSGRLVFAHNEFHGRS